MVEIRSIKTKACPVCGCTAVVEEYLERDVDHTIRTHCNGTRWEGRKFACGYAVVFEPNFLRERVSHKCCCDADEVKRKAKEQQAKADIEKQLKDSGCSEAFVARIMSAIQYI